MEIGQSRHWTSVFLSLCKQRKMRPRPAQERISYKKLKLLLKWMLIERWIRPTMLSSMCQLVPTLQFDSRAGKRQPSGTVMMGWIWCVWINAIVFVPRAQAPLEADANELLYSLQSKFDRWVYILVFAEGDLPRESFPHAFVDISVILWLCTRISQG